MTGILEFEENPLGIPEERLRAPYYNRNIIVLLPYFYCGIIKRYVLLVFYTAFLLIVRKAVD